MIAMPPTAITVAELPVEPDALQAFALEQNRLTCVLWEQLETLQHQIAQANRALRRQFRAAGGPGGTVRCHHGVTRSARARQGSGRRPHPQGPSGVAEGPAAQAR